jgi:hypothetical protein
MRHETDLHCIIPLAQSLQFSLLQKTTISSCPLREINSIILIFFLLLLSTAAAAMTTKKKENKTSPVLSDRARVYSATGHNRGGYHDDARLPPEILRMRPLSNKKRASLSERSPLRFLRAEGSTYTVRCVRETCSSSEHRNPNRTPRVQPRTLAARSFAAKYLTACSSAGITSSL